MNVNSIPSYEIYAIRYATTIGRRRSENFIAHDAHDGPMPMDYFVWLIRSAERSYLVDCGFNEEAARTRNRQFLRCPIASLQHLGIEPEEVTDMILTHLHYDHAGNIDLLPNARMHLQGRELDYATSKYMQFDVLRNAYSVDDVVHVVRGLYDTRVTLYDGDTQIAPGIELILVGGHTNGLQAVRVHTQRGWVVLASDASHFYENILGESPFPIVFHVGDMLEGYRTLLKRVPSRDHLVPGHDPLVRERYPTWGDPEWGIVALHLHPAPVDYPD